MNSDIVIVGGGVIGSSIAYFLATNPDHSGSITVVEKDPTYVNCSTTRSLGSIRQQFSTPENVMISTFGFEFLVNSGELLEIEGERPDVNLVQSSYLILANPERVDRLRSAHHTQIECGARVRFMDSTELSERFAWLNTDGIAAGCQGIHREGWFDPYSLLMAFRKKSIALGVRYLEDEVVDVRIENDRVREVTLLSKMRISCDSMVNAAGPAAGAFASKSGVDLPVSPRKRCVFSFKAAAPVENLPLIADPAGVYVRPEGDGYLCGWTPSENDPDPVDDSLDVDYDIFEEKIWPVLAHRIPQFDTLRLQQAWAGHYDFNSFDHNAILGAHPVITNYFMATGFTGHGIQQSPAVGRAMSELITYGDYQSLDLSRLNYARIPNQTKFVEINVI